uniref:Reticulocalbin-3 n=1 Tax=Syphacia muris TaxID=451379 RepID=A0A0N5A7K3_9BILA
MLQRSILLLGACIVLVVADREHEAHGSVSSKFRYEHEGEGHNEHSDHKAVLGSEKVAKEFDELSPEESRKRLRVLAVKMDVNHDGFVDNEELTDWIQKSIISLDKEESDERFAELDKDGNLVITWSEYIADGFGDIQETENMDAEDKKLMEEDRKYFVAADHDGNGVLNMEEFDAFHAPEHHPHMHETVVELTLKEKDLNKDGKIDLKEFLGDIAGNEGAEWYEMEKARFADEYDKDKSGFLEGEEIVAWLIPDTKVTAQQEAEHLIANADKDHDKRLSIDEIVDEYGLFVGSEATNYGEHLNKVKHEEL